MKFPRTQLTLYVPDDAAVPLTAVRHVVDPVQSRLIPPHVTLCRDEELVALSPATIGERLVAGPASALALTFGAVEAFDGHGLLLPCIDGRDAFDRLRAIVLGGETERRPLPHLTLAHPRNPRAPGNTPAAAAALPVPLVLTFTQVRWIEQESAEEPWRVRHTFALGAPR